MLPRLPHPLTRTLTAGLLLALAACTSPPSLPTLVPTSTARPTSIPTTTPTLTPTPTTPPTSTPTPPPTDTPTPPPTDTPALDPTAPSAPPGTPEFQSEAGIATPIADCSQYTPSPHSAINGRRFIAYYGSTGPGLGILGRYDISTTLALLSEQAQAYRELDPCVETVLAFHIIATVADAGPGEDGDYSHRIPHETIQTWIDGIRAAGGIAVLDIQPGQAALTTELDLIEPLLRQPGVHLAVDPEWTMDAGEIPGVNRGQLDGDAINAVQVWLNAIAEQTGEHKILVVHQFDDSFVPNKAVIQDYPLVDMVWDADGYGGPSAKIGDYNQYRNEAGFEYGGFKVFYDRDSPVMTPSEVMGLDPPPAYIIYQ